MIAVVPSPKSHSNLCMVDVAPVTVTVSVKIWLMFGVGSDAVMTTPGGWAGRIVTDVETVSVNPLASVAVALTCTCQRCCKCAGCW